MLTKNDIELYKQRFQNTLVGKWITIEGTFFLMSEIFEFYPDGTGIWISSSGLGESTTFFKWKINEPFVVEICETKVVDKFNNTTEVLEDEVEDWVKIEYEFKLITNDCGHQIALCDKGSDHFYLAQLRIGFSE